MKNYYGTAAAVLLSVVGSCASVSAQAGTGAAGATLLNASDRVQLATWLGEGAIRLDQVYAKAQGDTAKNFHLAADGKGRTISVMQASNEFGQTWLIGGYNPQSWSSTGGYNRTAADPERTAFLFNLTSGSVHRQTPATYGLGTVGSYQTYNNIKNGPTFGWGHDLYVPDNLSTGGYSSLYSYINPGTNVFGLSLLDGSQYHGVNLSFGAMEIYTIAVVPEPDAYGMLLAGLLVAGFAARRAKVKA